MKQERTIWFVAKRYGWGWTPATWQGWLVVGVWSAVFTGSIVGIQLVLGDSPSGTFWSLAVGFVLTGILLIITYRTGELPAWHWGNKTNKK